MDNIISSAINFLARPESLLVLGGIVLIIAGVFSSIKSSHSSIDLSNSKSVISFATGFVLIIISMATSWLPLFDKKIGCKELLDVKAIVSNSRDMVSIAQRNCGGDFICDKRTLLSYNRSGDAMNYIDTTIGNNPSVKSSCPK